MAKKKKDDEGGDAVGEETFSAAPAPAQAVDVESDAGVVEAKAAFKVAQANAQAAREAAARPTFVPAEAEESKALREAQAAVAAAERAAREAAKQK